MRALIAMVMMLAATSAFAASNDTCVGHCGNKAATCWCDAVRETAGDCCADVATACEESTPTVVASSGEGACDGGVQGCFCDAMCTQAGDCCADYQAVCQSQTTAT